MARSGSVDERRAARVVARVTAWRAVRSGAIWGLVFGGAIASIALSYDRAFPTSAARERLASSLGGNIGLTALYGQARRIDTVAGFTAWRSGALVWIGAIWGLLIATRLLRGEEEAGRWELFLAGRTTRRHAAMQALAGLGAGLAALWILTAGFTVAIGSTSSVGFSIGGSLFFATTLLAGAAVFLAVGMLVAELGATRHQANVIGAAVLGAGLLIRMVADAGVGLPWLRWLSPFGWIQELHPLTGSNLGALIPIAGLIVACVAAAVRLAGARDMGSSALPSRETSPPRTRLLNGQVGLTVRLTRPLVASWAAGLTVCGLLFGLFAQAATDALRGTKTMEDVIARLGGSGGAAASFLGLEFVFVALLVAFAGAGQIAAARAEEAQGHLDHLFARPVARWCWMAGRLGVAAGLVLCTSVLTGAAAWAGAASQHTGLGFGRLVEAGLNVAPAALFVLGVGMLAFGLRPRIATGVTYGLLAWSFLVELVASLVNGNHWLLDTSFLTHIAPVPAADPNWTASAWLVGLGFFAALAGILAFRRRDLATA